MKKIKSYFSVHYSFLIMIGISFFTGLTLLFFMYFLCLVLHEISHAFIAKKCGYKIGKIKLLATGAVLDADCDEFSFSDEIKIASAGPLLNLILSFLIIVFWWICPESYNYTLDLFVVNLSIFAFNMLPIFPLDGGRILLALISKKTDRILAVKIVRSVTVILSILLFGVFLLSFCFVPKFNLGLIAITLFISGVSEDKNAAYKKIFYFSKKMEKIKKLGVEKKELYVHYMIDKTKLLKLINSRNYTIFILVDDDMKIKRILSEEDLLNTTY